MGKDGVLFCFLRFRRRKVRRANAREGALFLLPFQDVVELKFNNFIFIRDETSALAVRQMAQMKTKNPMKSLMGM
jgi:hypothetical protein